MDLRAAIEAALFENELSSNPNAIYRFSDAKKGNSGLSFGRTQLDVANNPAAVACLKACGFNSTQIGALQIKRADLPTMNAKLKAAAQVVDLYDARQMDECLHHVLDVATVHGIHFANDEAIVEIADYHNQFDLAPNGKLARYLAKFQRPVTREDIHKFKLENTKWGQTREGKEDINRRYANITKVCKELA